jgi:hypothetical protein
MDFQILIVAILFLGAIFYIAKSLFLNLKAKKGCGSSCKCSVDFSETDKKK